MYQSERMQQMPEVGEKVAVIISKLTKISMGSAEAFPFTIIGDFYWLEMYKSVLVSKKHIFYNLTD